MSRHFKDVSHAIADWQPAWQRLKEPSPNATESKTFDLNGKEPQQVSPLFCQLGNGRDFSRLFRPFAARGLLGRTD